METALPILLEVAIVAISIYFTIRRRKEEIRELEELENSNDVTTGDSNEFPPENYMVWAILQTILCLPTLPCGIVAIIKASSVNSAWRAGFKKEALRNSIKAKSWCIYAACSIGWILGLTMVVGLFAGVISLIMRSSQPF